MSCTPHFIGTLSQGAENVNLDFTVVDSSLDSISLANTTVNYVFKFVSGVVKVLVGTIVDEDSGLVRYTTQTGDISEYGLLLIQLRVIRSGKEIPSEIKRMTVIERLE